MTFNATIERDFLGTVNGIEIKDKGIYLTAVFTLEQLQEHDLDFNNDFIEELVKALEEIVSDKGAVAWGEVEDIIYYDVVNNGLLGCYFEECNDILETLNN